MVCDKHGVEDCAICLQYFWNVSNPTPEPLFVLSPWMIKNAIMTIKTQAAVKAARERIEDAHS